MFSRQKTHSSKSFKTGFFASNNDSTSATGEKDYNKQKQQMKTMMQNKLPQNLYFNLLTQ